jgi:DNA-binding GntR family transcriptional regulator
MSSDRLADRYAAPIAEPARNALRARLAAWAAAGIRPTELAVLVAIYCHIGDRGGELNAVTIAGELGVSPRYTREVIGVLVELGLITVGANRGALPRYARVCPVTLEA